MSELDEIKEQSLNNYKLAVQEIINNNTLSLLEDDIMSLLKKPPLDSMDIIKNKFLLVAKRENIILNTVNLDKKLEIYRERINKDIIFIKNIRIDMLSKTVSNFNPKKEFDTIKITKKDLSSVNKKINSQLKEKIKININRFIIDEIINIYNGINNIQYNKIYNELSKYFRTVYQKQLVENINIKILVKDTTLINGVKEQGERYIFTKTNSRINDL